MVAVAQFLSGERSDCDAAAAVLLVPKAAAGGRWHPDLSTFIKRYIKASCGDDIKTYVYKLKATKQRVSVALRRSTSRAIMEMQRRAKAYPVVAVDAAA